MSAHGNSQPAATCNSEASRCTPGLTAGAGHPQLTSSRQVRMRTLPYRQRLAPTAPEGVATGDLGHPVTPHRALLKTEKPPTRALGQVQTSGGEGQERKQRNSGNDGTSRKAGESGWNGWDGDEARGTQYSRKRKESADKSDSHGTLTFTSWIGCGPMQVGRGQNWPDSCRVQTSLPWRTPDFCGVVWPLPNPWQKNGPP